MVQMIFDAPPHAGRGSAVAPQTGLARWHVSVPVVAALWLFKGVMWSVAALVGGGIVVIGGVVFGQVALGGGIQTSAGALGRMLAGMMLKWVVVIGGLIASVLAGLPPLALTTGVIAALMAQMLTMIGRQQGSKA